MKIHDISLPVHDHMPGFPGDPPVQVVRTRSLADGKPYNLSAMAMSSHSGTHVDPPLHFIPNGTPADGLDLRVMVGPVRVIEIPLEEKAILPAHFTELGPTETRALFKTSNSPRWKAAEKFFEDYVALSPAGAEEAVRRQVRLIGVDSLSIEAFGSSTFPVHHTLLGHGTLILEGLLLDDVAPGVYELIFLPLRLQGGDGAPGRAILLER